MKMVQKGFTLIELMIVVAIIAIRAAIALPAYQDYVVRSQVSEGSVLADGAKTAVAEYFTNTGNFPSNNAAAGLAASTSITGKYVKTVDASGGVIAVTYSSASPNVASKFIDGDILAFSPNTSAGSVAWHCSATATGAVKTNIPDKYLPTSCRGANQ